MCTKIKKRHVDDHIFSSALSLTSDMTQVGNALKKVIPSVVRREELFITSKLWNDAHHPSEVERQLDATLSQLGTPYLDLYLIHWPVAFVRGREMSPLRAGKPDEVEVDTDTSVVDTWKAMLALRDTGKVKAVGVSNFTIQHLEAIIKATGERPAVNQVEAHPLLPQDDLVKYCKKQGIHITAYSPLGNNREWRRADGKRRCTEKNDSTRQEEDCRLSRSDGSGRAASCVRCTGARCVGCGPGLLCDSEVGEQA